MATVRQWSGCGLGGVPDLIVIVYCDTDFTFRGSKPRECVECRKAYTTHGWSGGSGFVCVHCVDSGERTPLEILCGGSR